MHLFRGASFDPDKDIPDLENQVLAASSLLGVEICLQADIGLRRHRGKLWAGLRHYLSLAQA